MSCDAIESGMFLLLVVSPEENFALSYFLFFESCISDIIVYLLRTQIHIFMGKIFFKVFFN